MEVHYCLEAIDACVMFAVVEYGSEELQGKFNWEGQRIRQATNDNLISYPNPSVISELGHEWGVMKESLGK